MQPVHVVVPASSASGHLLALEVHLCAILRFAKSTDGESYKSSNGTVQAPGHLCITKYVYWLNLTHPLIESRIAPLRTQRLDRSDLHDCHAPSHPNKNTRESNPCLAQTTTL
jgi:hypothetical protein